MVDENPGSTEGVCMTSVKSAEGISMESMC